VVAKFVVVQRILRNTIEAAGDLSKEVGLMNSSEGTNENSSMRGFGQKIHSRVDSMILASVRQNDGISKEDEENREDWPYSDVCWKKDVQFVEMGVGY